MSDEMNMTPELTLTPNLEGAAAIEAPALTLDPTAAGFCGKNRPDRF